MDEIPREVEPARDHEELAPASAVCRAFVRKSRETRIRLGEGRLT